MPTEIVSSYNYAQELEEKYPEIFSRTLYDPERIANLGARLGIIVLNNLTEAKKEEIIDIVTTIFGITDDVKNWVKIFLKEELE